MSDKNIEIKEVELLLEVYSQREVAKYICNLRDALEWAEKTIKEYQKELKLMKGECNDPSF